MMTARNSITSREIWSSVYHSGIIPQGMELIQDSMPLKVMDTKILTESRGGRRTDVLKLTGTFQKADEQNANGRVYPFDILTEAVENLQDAIKNRRVMGEFDHPPDAKIHMDRVSHLLTRLWMDGKTVIGELEVINDDRCPYGAQLACLIERDVQVGISSRGVGDMQSTRLAEGDEILEVQPGFNFVTFDAVAEPSVSDTQLMVMESRERNLRVGRGDRANAEVALLEEFNRLFGR